MVRVSRELSSILGILDNDEHKYFEEVRNGLIKSCDSSGVLPGRIKVLVSEARVQTLDFHIDDICDIINDAYPILSLDLSSESFGSILRKETLDVKGLSEVIAENLSIDDFEPRDIDQCITR